ncbi:class 1 isoprenoid biosynthesis enzyme [bacterium]|nr:MAG: class 1 isoprenoid biosynthesis enzyme [bacterium]
MTLSPVFQDLEKLNMVIEALGKEDFDEALSIQKGAVERLYASLPSIIGPSSIDGELFGELCPKEDSRFAQRYFFITLFTLILKDLGIPKSRLDFYSALNYCIMGTTAAADNLFDGEDKAFLPLKQGGGSVYTSVLQLMCFERLVAKEGREAVASGLLDDQMFDLIQKGILDKMAKIGSLEGSEEGGVKEIPTPEEMVRNVHGVRGGMLFELATVAPSVLEGEEIMAQIQNTADAVKDLGTAFQIIDDLTDFEFDLTRKSHNILVSEIHHNGNAAEKKALALALEKPPGGDDFVESHAMESGRRAFETAVSLITSSIMKIGKVEAGEGESLCRELAVCFASTRGTPRLKALCESL